MTADPLPLPDDVFQRAVESFRNLPRDQRDIADVRVVCAHVWHAALAAITTESDTTLELVIAEKEAAEKDAQAAREELAEAKRELAEERHMRVLLDQDGDKLAARYTALRAERDRVRAVLEEARSTFGSSFQAVVAINDVATRLGIDLRRPAGKGEDNG